MLEYRQVRGVSMLEFPRMVGPLEVLLEGPLSWPGVSHICSAPGLVVPCLSSPDIKASLAVPCLSSPGRGHAMLSYARISGTGIEEEQDRKPPKIFYLTYLQAEKGNPQNFLS